MLKLELSKIPFYVINMEKDQEKRLYIKGQLEELGLQYEFVPGVKVNPHPIGIALSHLKILNNEKFKLPFVILEDDCRFFFDRIQKIIELPDATDGFYLGHSSFGVQERPQKGIRWGKHDGVKYEIYNNQYLRIHSMLARHGIMYISERFRTNAINANVKALTYYEGNFPGDLAYAAIQSNHVLLSPHQPWCYQSELFWGNWLATKRSILDIKDGLVKKL